MIWIASKNKRVFKSKKHKKISEDILVEVDFEAVSDASSTADSRLVVDAIHPAANDQRPLHNERDEEQREANATVAVSLQEGHQEAEAEESDGVQVLEERVVLQALRRVVVAEHAEQNDEEHLEDQEEYGQQELEIALLDRDSLMNEAVLVGDGRGRWSWRDGSGSGSRRLRHHGERSLLGRHGRDHHLGLVDRGARRLLRALARRGGRLLLQ